MKKHITIAEDLKHWVDLLEIIRKHRPKHAEYISKHLIIDARKESLVYSGSMEAIANVLEWALLRK